MSVPPNQMQAGIAGVVDKAASVNPDGTDVPQDVQDAVKKLRKEYDGAREFDKAARLQYNKDRRYAQGVSDLRWASDANIIGAFIDILCSFLYAKNPDVSVRPAPRVGGTPTPDESDFADTLQIVVSRLWKDAKLKQAMKKIVRSSLSVGPGWVKALMYSEQRQNPALEKELGDARDNLAKIQALQDSVGGLDGEDDDREAQATELQNQITGLQAQVELMVKRGLCLDFVRAEDMQVSLDVASTADYLDADWVSNDMYIRKEDLKARFSELSDEDVRQATPYHQRQTGAGNPDNQVVVAESTVTEGQFAKGIDNQGHGQAISTGDKPVEFAKVTELWDHRDNLIKTFIDGVKRWAVTPYAPPQASNRFYPYFKLALYPVDGARHPQSLSWRLMKLQDEYAHTRSNGRLTRERSVPGTIFNKGQLDPEDVERIQSSTHLEMVGVQPTNNDLPLDRVLTAKPIPRVDPLLFDTSPVQRDMNTLSGVNEAQQGEVVTNQTATAADIAQSGFTSRTGADRDTIEDMLTELAQYTAELAVQSLTSQDVQRMAGPLSFWPEGMDAQDVLTMVEVEITAGTTGKPRAQADKETWATLLPLITNMMGQVSQLQLVDPAQAQGYKNLLEETLKRLDDRLSIDKIFPPPKPNPVIPGAQPGLGTALAPGVAPPPPPPVGNGTVNNPTAIAPQPPSP